MIPAGLMKPKAATTRCCSRATPRKATGVGITVEPEGGSKTPTTEPIAMFELDKADA